jgi:hypothetical protein
MSQLKNGLTSNPGSWGASIAKGCPQKPILYNVNRKFNFPRWQDGESDDSNQRNPKYQ